MPCTLREENSFDIMRATYVVVDEDAVIEVHAGLFERSADFVGPVLVSLAVLVVVNVWGSLGDSLRTTNIYQFLGLPLLLPRLLLRCRCEKEPSM